MYLRSDGRIFYPTDSVHHFMKISLNGHCERSESAKRHIASGVGGFGQAFTMSLLVSCCVACLARSGCEWKHPGSCKEKDEMPTDHAVTTGMKKQEM